MKTKATKLDVNPTGPLGEAKSVLDVATLVGVELEVAESTILKYGLGFVVVMQDGKAVFPADKSLNPNRVSLIVEKGIVTGADWHME